MPRQNDRPVPGDVLITSEVGIHFLSVVPHPHRLSFKEVSQALAIGMQWANANGGEVWHHSNGDVLRVRDEQRAVNRRQ